MGLGIPETPSRSSLNHAGVGPSGVASTTPPDTQSALRVSSTTRHHYEVSLAVGCRLLAAGYGFGFGNSKLQPRL